MRGHKPAKFSRFIKFIRKSLRHKNKRIILFLKVLLIIATVTNQWFLKFWSWFIDNIYLHLEVGIAILYVRGIIMDYIRKRERSKKERRKGKRPITP